MSFSGTEEDGGQSSSSLPGDRRPAYGDDPAAGLAPYLPRITLSWLAESPGAAHRRADGTMVFVDVSGFTGLTERLAARGKAGVEELTDLIGSVFGPLLGIATDYGADLLKWGGDAVLLYFPEPGSAARACRAAVLMSREMGRIGRFRTSAGRFTLGVSIGAHSGSFDLYLLGYGHRELIVTGPAVTVTAQMEALAGTGEVVVSSETASRLEPGDLGDPRPAGTLVARAPRAETVPPAARPVLPGPAIASLLPAQRRMHLLGGGEQAEHRQATVAFLEFSGIDALTEDGGPERVAAALGPVIAATEEAAEWNGVHFHETDIGADGGKIVILGGVPLVRGNDADKVLRAVRDVLGGHSPASPVRLRAGVNAGRVFVFSHDFGLAQRRIFSVTGDTMNLAARVLGRAGPGQVIATQAALARIRSPFETEPVPPFTVKGKSDPVIAATVGRPRYAISEEVGGGLGFVGRQAELEGILGRADAAADGSGSVVEIVGVPGIGKSRLVSEAMDRWTLTTLRVTCEEYGSATPYLPFRQVMRSLLGLADDTPHDSAADALRRAVHRLALDWEPFLPLLADVVDVPVPSTRQVEELEQRFRRPRLEHFVVHLLRAYLVNPSALVFEDAHAIDEASASLLRRIVLEATELPLLVLLTRHPGGHLPLAEGPGPRLVFELAPLAEDDATRLALNGGGPSLAPPQVAAIVERAGGNPLFLRELLRRAGEAGDIEGLPESLEPLLVAQIDRLSPSDRQVLRAAAVLGRRFDPVLLEELLDGSGWDEAVWSRLGAFVVPTTGGHQFSHGLIRDAAYEGLAFRRRKELHARAARAIEARTSAQGEGAELLSLHWFHAERYDEAWRYARLAGDRARALWANEEAATFYARALEAAGRLNLPRSEVLAVAEALGDASELTGSYDRARHAYSRARRLADSAVDRARLLRKLGVLHERQGRYSEALSCYTRGRRLLTEATSAAATERSELDLASAGVMERQGRHTEGIAFATKAADEAARADHRSGLAHALYLQHLMSVSLAAPADELAHESLAIFEELGDLVGQGNVLNNLGIGAYYQGRWAESLDCYERSRRVRLRSGDVVGAATAENNIAEILSDQGKFEEARTLLESARGTWLAAGYRVGVALATSNLGHLMARAGDVSAGRQLLDRALADFQGIRSPVFVAETQLRIVECQVLEGDFRGAMTSALALLRGVRGRSGLEQTEVAALRLLGTATALAALVEGQAPGPGGSSASLDEAVERSATLTAPYELALALATRAALRQRGGAPDETAEDPDLHRAEEIFSNLGIQQAVITWSPQVAGGPLFARKADSAAPEG
jgi:class 3 adenylate cyclase/tetratricopeptide (TPR) repeat protein